MAVKVPTASLAVKVVEAVAWLVVGGGAAGPLLEGMDPATNIWCRSLHNNSLAKIKRSSKIKDVASERPLENLDMFFHLLRKHKLILTLDFDPRASKVTKLWSRRR